MNSLAPRIRLPRPTDRLALGTTGLKVSPFCLGAVGAPEIIGAAFDAGINFFFVTADMHWPYYTHTRTGLSDLFARGGGIRDQVVVAAVSYVTQPEFCTRPFEELVLATPGLERLEVLVAGGAYGHEIDRRHAVYVEHRRTRFMGAGAIGISFHDRKAAAFHAAHRKCDIAFVRYNTRHPGARQDLFPILAATEDRSVVFNFNSTRGMIDPELLRRTLGDERWIPLVSDGYRFALTEPCLDGLLIALKRVEELTLLTQALEEGPLSQDEMEYMLELATAFPPVS